MKRILALTILLLALSQAAGAEVTLRTASTFGGTDPGAQAYAELLAEWEAVTGNHIEDVSSNSDEAWKAGVLNDFAAGNEPDVLLYFAGTADSQPILNMVVPIHEINEAYPDVNLAEDERLREADGNVYAVEVRGFWEGLFCNIDLFEAYDVALPTDVASFETAIAVFQENGIVPLAISLSDIPHYLVECAILSSGSPEDHRVRPMTPAEIPDAWVRGLELIRHLYEIGAFPRNVNFTSEELTTAMFLNKEAAMLLDGSWRINAFSEASWQNTIVLPFPAYDDEANPRAIIGGVSTGFYVTRRAWEDETKRDAAVDLLAFLTSDYGRERLGLTFGGKLKESVDAMEATARAEGVLMMPIGDYMDTDVRTYLFGQIPGIADGNADPTEVITETIERGAFR